MVRHAHPCGHQGTGSSTSCRCEVDEDHEGYKRFKLQQRGTQWQAEGFTPAEGACAADPAALPAAELAHVRLRRLPPRVPALRAFAPAVGEACGSPL